MADCRCCEKKTPTQGARVCPECGHTFVGNGWDGIDAHWRAKHNKVMSYDEFRKGMCGPHRGK